MQRKRDARLPSNAWIPPKSKRDVMCSVAVIISSRRRCSRISQFNPSRSRQIYCAFESRALDFPLTNPFTDSSVILIFDVFRIHRPHFTNSRAVIFYFMRFRTETHDASKMIISRKLSKNLKKVLRIEFLVKDFKINKNQFDLLFRYYF